MDIFDIISYILRVKHKKVAKIYLWRSSEKDYGIYFLIQTLIAQGENEIDIIAEDELDNKIEFIKVKRQVKNTFKYVVKRNQLSLTEQR